MPYAHFQRIYAALLHSKELFLDLRILIGVLRHHPVVEWVLDLNPRLRRLTLVKRRRLQLEIDAQLLLVELLSVELEESFQHEAGRLHQLHMTQVSLDHDEKAVGADPALVCGVEPSLEQYILEEYEHPIEVWGFLQRLADEFGGADAEMATLQLYESPGVDREINLHEDVRLAVGVELEGGDICIGRALCNSEWDRWIYFLGYKSQYQFEDWDGCREYGFF